MSYINRYDLSIFSIAVVFYVMIHISSNFSFTTSYGGEFNPIDLRWAEDHLPFNSFWIGPGLNWEAHSRLGTDGLMSLFNAVPYSIIAILQYCLNTGGVSRNILVEMGTKTFGLLSSYILLRYLYGPSWGAVVGSVGFCWNTYFAVSWNGGQYAENLAGSLTPLWFLSFFRFILGRPRIFTNALLMSILTPIVPIYSYMNALFAIQIYILIKILNYKTNNLLFLIKSALIITLQSIMFVFPWLLGSLYMGESVTYPNNYNSIEMFRNLSKNTYSWYDALSLNHPFWPDIYSWGTFPLHEINVVRYCIPVIITYFVIRISSEKINVAIYCAYITSGFMSKGASGVASQLNEWIFENIVGMNYFRTSGKFSIVCSLMAILLIAQIINYYIKRISRSQSVGLIMGSLWFLGVGNVLPIIYPIAENWRPNGSIPTVIDSELIAFDRELETVGLPVRVLVYPWGGETAEKASSKQYVGLYHVSGSEWSKFVRPTRTMQEAYDYFFSTQMARYILQFSNIAYVIVPIDDQGYVFGRDGMGNGADAPGRSELARRLHSSPGLVEVEEPYRRLHVFKVVGPRSEAFLTDSIKEFDTATMAPDYDRSQSFTDPIMLAAVPNDAGSQGVRSIGNSRYIIDNSAKKSHFILSHNYSDDWHAFLFSKKQINQDCGVWCRWSFENKGFMWWYFASNTLGVSEFTELDHFRVNGFAQGWRIPEGDEKLVVVEFKPQRAYEIGWLVSCSAGVCASLWLSSGYLKKYLLGHVTSA